MPGQELGNQKPFLYIVNGNWAQKVPEDYPKAHRREWKLPTGESGVKYERYFISWTGKLKEFRFKEYEFGDICYIDLNDVILSLPVNSRYFTNMASRLPNADLSKEITFHPYDMESNGKRNRGISLTQGQEKLGNYYWDAETKKAINGLPVVNEDEKEDKGYWKFYFSKVSAFLVQELENMTIPESEEEEHLKPAQENSTEQHSEEADQYLPF